MTSGLGFPSCNTQVLAALSLAFGEDGSSHRGGSRDSERDGLKDPEGL